MGIGPSTKETTLHHFRDPLLEVVAADTDLDLMGIIIVGTPDDNKDKMLVGTRTAVWAEAMRADGVILSSDGWGNSDVDYTNTCEQLGIRGIPVTGLNFSGTVAQFVVVNDYLDGIVDINKSEDGTETNVVGENGKKEPKEEAASPMIEKLEKSLEETISTLPPGQLSEEQKKLFAYFTSVRGMNRQLAELLEEDRMRKGRREDSLVGNIVITGERGNGKSTLAADIVKALQKQRRVKGAKMAKIAAESLNGKSVSDIIAKLGGGALLIERAGNLKTQTAVQLSHAMTRRTGGLLVILEDEKEEIRRLFTRCESLGAKFTRTIEIPVFTNKELVAFGESYAQERDCVLDEMAVLALYNRIGNSQTSDHLVNVAEVKEMVDEAIDKRGKRGLFGRTKKSRMDEFGHLILLEKDFEK